MGDPVQGDEGGRMQLRPRSAHHAHGLGHELVRPRRHRERPRVPSADLLKRGWRGRKPHSDAHDVTWWYGSGCMLSAIQRAPWLLGDARPSPRCILQCMCMVLPTGQAAQRPRAVDSIGLILSSGPRKGWGRSRRLGERTAASGPFGGVVETSPDHSARPRSCCYTACTAKSR